MEADLRVLWKPTIEKLINEHGTTVAADLILDLVLGWRDAEATELKKALADLTARVESIERASGS